VKEKMATSSEIQNFECLERDRKQKMKDADDRLLLALEHMQNGIATCL
jgi:hypothetical protein